jgi:hypothetical protein
MPRQTLHERPIFAVPLEVLQFRQPEPATITAVMTASIKGNESLLIGFEWRLNSGEKLLFFARE